MASKTVNNQRKASLRVGGSALDEARAERAMQGMMRRFADVLPAGTTEITVAEAQILLGRQLEYQRGQLVFKDNDHVREITYDSKLRRQRDEAAAELFGKVSSARAFFESQYGKGSSIDVFGAYNEEIPRDPVRLHQYAARAAAWLSDPGFVRPTGKLAGVEMAPAQLASSFAAPLARLGDALETLATAEQQSVDALVAKYGTLTSNDRLVGQGARFLEALYDIAGMEGQADRVRPSSHQAREQPEAAPGEGEAPAAEATAAPGGSEPPDAA